MPAGFIAEATGGAPRNEERSILAPRAEAKPAWSARPGVAIVEFGHQAHAVAPPALVSTTTRGDLPVTRLTWSSFLATAGLRRRQCAVLVASRSLRIHAIGLDPALVLYITSSVNANNTISRCDSPAEV